MTEHNLTVNDAIKKAEIVNENMQEDYNSDIALKEFKKAKDHSQAKLYTSLSRLFAWSAIGFVIFVFILIVWWAYLQYAVTFNDYDEPHFQMMLKLIDKLEGLFSYIITTLLGYASGINKLFLSNKEE